MRRIAVILITAFAMFAISARSDVITSDPADGQVGEDGSVTQTNNTIAYTVKGAWGGDPTRSQIEMPFRLPNLGSVVNPFRSATLSFSGNHNGDQWAGSALDLKGLNQTRPSPALLGSDWSASATLIQPGIMTWQNGAGVYSTSADGATNLARWLNSQYAGGTNAGQFVFLTLWCSNPNSWHWYEASMSEAGAGQPTLVYDVFSHPNTAPMLPFQSNRVVNPLAQVTIVNTAYDSDQPANLLAYALLTAPTNAVISTNGVITWTPTLAQDHSTNLIVTVVTDNGVPPLSATNSFTIVVTEINSAPVLPIQPNRVVSVSTPLTVINTATDSDLPPNTLTYSLLNPPANATISTNGIIKWTPSLAQNRTTNTFTTIVNDNGTPPLSATNSFIVIVTELTNLLAVNPSFESGSGWFGNGNYSFPGWTGANYRWNGNFGTAGGTDGQQMFEIDWGGSISTAPASRPVATPGFVYQLRYDLRTIFNNNPGYWLGTKSFLDFFDDAGNLVKTYWGPDWTPQVQPCGVYDWQTISVTGVAPTNATRIGVRIEAPAGTFPNEDIRKINLDNFRITRLDEPLDRLAIRRAPRLIEPGKPATLAIHHAAVTARTLTARLVSSGGATKAEVSLPVNAGRSFDALNVQVPADLPNGNYSWQIALIPQGGSWNQAVAVKNITNAFSDTTASLPVDGGQNFDADHTNIVYMGRWDDTNPKQRWMHWFSSEVRVRFSGTSLALRGSIGDNGYGGVYPADMLVVIDETNTIPVTLNQFSFVAPLISNLPAGIHTARLFKAGESDQRIRVDGFRVDAGRGLLRPSPLPNRRIEIFGDSVTSGGSASPTYLGYAPMLGRELDADVHVISKGGTGVAASFSGLDTLLHYWNNLSFPNAFDAGAGLKWNTSKWTPDAVIMAIGHNDQFNGGADNFAACYSNFNSAVRTAYPKAHLLSMNTIISTPMVMFQSAFTPLLAADANHSFAFQQYSWTDPNTGHPPTAGHNAMVYGDACRFSIAEVIEKRLGWDLDAPLNGYEQWVLNQFSPSEIAAGLHSPTATVGGDNCPNLERYALGLPAHGPIPSQTLITPGFDASGRFKIWFAPANTDVKCIFELSDDLTSWKTAGSSLGSAGSTVVFTDTSTPTTAQRFARIRYSLLW